MSHEQQKHGGSALAEPPDAPNVLADAARLGGKTGKSLDAAVALGEIAAVDGTVNAKFAAAGRGDADSPLFNLVWGPRKDVIDILQLRPKFDMSVEAEQAVREIEGTAKALLHTGELWGSDGRISEASIAKLAKVGFLRLLVPTEYGGYGISCAAALQVQSRLAQIHPIFALFISVHGLIGAVNPLRLYGTEAQKQKWLPQLCETSSAFALTEPGAGSDVKSIKVTAVLDGDEFVVNGEKMFITNMWYDRIASLVAMVTGPDGKTIPRVLIIRTPSQDTDSFHINAYGLHALKRTHNVGVTFTNFRVPKEDLLDAPGLEIAFNGLNAARIAVNVNSTVAIKELLAALLPWSRRRVVMKKKIGERPLVDARLAEALALGYGCEVLWHFCAAVLQEGFRGEGECIVAKVFGSDSAWHVVSELYARTMGGRTLLVGDPGGDALHDIRAEAIYEGENSMLMMKLLDVLLRGQVDRFLMPMLANLQKRGVKKLNMANPLHLFWLAVYGAPQGMEFVKRLARYSIGSATDGSAIGLELNRRGVRGLHNHYAMWAIRRLEGLGLRLMVAMFKYQTAMPERQNQLRDFAWRAQNLLVMALTAVEGATCNNDEKSEAALLLCAELQRQLKAPVKSDDYYRSAARFGRGLYEHDCEWTAVIDPAHVAYRAEYDDKNVLDKETVAPRV